MTRDLSEKLDRLALNDFVCGALNKKKALLHVDTRLKNKIENNST